MNLIEDRLYLGGISDACDTERLRRENITHILSLDVKPPSPAKTAKFICKFIEIEDDEDSNILMHFEDCIAFIEDAKSDGGILVHCFVGLSRSATVVIAYLMNKYKLSLSEAFKTVRSKRRDICPNSGFYKQLELYEKMGCRIDIHHPEYQKFKMAQLVSTFNAGEIPFEMLAEDPSTEMSLDEVISIYRCKKCRRALFDTGAILLHDKGKGATAFDWRKPVQWMAESITIVEGKITCPKCKSKIGSFSWVGERCRCGTFVTPSFQIQSRKVENIALQPKPALRQPPVLNNDDSPSSSPKCETSEEIS